MYLPGDKATGFLHAWSDWSATHEEWTEEDLGGGNKDLSYFKVPCGHMSGTTLENCEITQSK